MNLPGAVHQAGERKGREANKDKTVIISIVASIYWVGGFLFNSELKH